MDDDQIAARIRLALDREAARHQLSPGAWPRIERRLGRRGRRQTAIVAACLALAAAATVTTYLWHGVSGPAVSHPHQRPAPQLVLASRTHLAQGITDLAAGYGGVWVIGNGVIYRVDPATARTVTTIPIPGIGEWSHPATGAGAVWVTTGIQAGHAGVYRIDPRRNRVTAFIGLPPHPIDITVAYGHVWVSEPRAGPGMVLRIDPRTNRVSGPPIRAGTGVGGIVAGFGALWVTNGDANGSVTRINPATGATRTLVNIPDVSAVGAGSLWVIPNHGGIERVDPATGGVTAIIGLPDAASVIFWAGSAWAEDDTHGTVVRIDPASNRVVGKAVPAGTSPTYIAAGPSGLWVVDFTTWDLLEFAVAPTVK
jgi:DNA-binding beta-propeller fold protein YncE